MRNARNLSHRLLTGLISRRTARMLVVVSFVTMCAVLAAQTHTQMPPRLMLNVNEVVSASVKAQFAQRGAQDSIIIHQSTFDPDNNGLFEHRDEFIAKFASLVPRSYAGPVCLDWEGMGFLRLTTPIGSATHTSGVQAFVSVINLAKQIRPAAQLGFYGLPMSEYWNRNAAWRQRNFALAPIVAASDCLFPSVYDFYKSYESPHHDPRADLQYVSESVKMALEMSGGKPVYAYIWPRYHESNPVYGYRLIPGAEFKEHVAAVFNAEFRGDRPDGLVWFGADRYFRWFSQQSYPFFHPHYHLAAYLNDVFEDEIPDSMTDDAYFTSIHKKTLRQLSDIIRAAQ